MTLKRKFSATVLCLSAVLFSGAQQALAQITITGTVGSSRQYLISGSAINSTTSSVLKIAFGATTAGTNLELCAGTTAEFTAGKCGTVLSDSGGPGFTFLTVVDAAKLNGQSLYVLVLVGSTPASFTLSIE